jgi:hypothetical protein
VLQDSERIYYITIILILHGALEWFWEGVGIFSYKIKRGIVFAQELFGEAGVSFNDAGSLKQFN